MDYSTILSELNNASLFELYRLNVAIRQQLKDPARIGLIKNSLKTGQSIKYFEASENRLIDAQVLELKRTKVLIENKHDGEHWNIPYYFINIDDVDIEIRATSKQKINRNNLKAGDKVCFKDIQGNEIFGEVFKLNQKTAGVSVGKIKWRVAYSLLSPIIDGELAGENNLLES